MGGDRALLMDRRKALTLLGGVGLGALAAACGTRPSGTGSPGSTTTSSIASATGTEPSCLLTPEMTEGPYYLDVNMVRSDITEGKTGTPLTLDLTVVDTTTCEPIKDSAVDVWHADAEGVYSGFGGASTGGNLPGVGAPPTDGPGPGGPGGGQQSPTDNNTFLRGIQMTDANGKAQFKTIYPGWYQGRAVHIHVKVSTGGNEVHTGQFFFPEDISDAVFDGGVYASRGDADTTNENDNIFSNGGKDSTLKMSRNGDGYTGSLTLGVKQS